MYIDMTKIIATVNQSGGVGKTSLTHNLGYHLSQKHRVLLIDMDPQASLTAFMGLGGEKLTTEQNIYGAITERAPLHIWDNPIHGMYIIPTNKDLAGTEREIMQDMTVDNRMRLKLVLDDILDQFDYILIDCPPSLGLLSVMSLIAATHVIIPLQTQYKCYLGTSDLLGTIARIKKGGHQKLEIACIVPTMYDGRNLQDAGILEEVKKQVQGRIHITTPIPKSTAFPDATQAHVPLALYKKSHPAVKILQEIANYITEL
ncbi:chromosome partitioning protein ParA [Scytonema hofmannii PCC 7110]|uniref:Chromosome partitioning protein ParA n=2 Tax=Scytonema hofmannii TaxID=34078 RepID=A0A139WQ12_9CYAN|nr:chromosome partitioning protein ParA [Scytonema hofmannii PCC 7110]